MTRCERTQSDVKSDRKSAHRDSFCKNNLLIAFAVNRLKMVRSNLGDFPVFSTRLNNQFGPSMCVCVSVCACVGVLALMCVYVSFCAC